MNHQHQMLYLDHRNIVGMVVRYISLNAFSKSAIAPRLGCAERGSLVPRHRIKLFEHFIEMAIALRICNGNQLHMRITKDIAIIGH